MDLEERKRQLAELKAAREAKQRQMERLAQSTAAAAASPQASNSSAAAVNLGSTTSSVASPVRQAAPGGDGVVTSPTTSIAASPSSHHHTCPNTVTVSSAGVVDVPPVEKHSRSTDTDAVFVYLEEREHPSVYFEKERRVEELEMELQRLKDEIQQLQQQQAHNNAAHSDSNNRPVMLQRRGFTFLDKTNTTTSRNAVNTPVFIDFVRRGVSHIEALKSASAYVVGDATYSSAAALSASFGNGTLNGGTSLALAPEQSAAAAVRLFRRCVLRDVDAAKDRVVSSLSFTNSPDTVLVALSAAESTGAASTPQGLVLLWNIRRPNQPPLRFTCQDEVKVVTFSPFHEHLIIGGTSSGRIVCWNALSGETPIAVSFPSLDAHRSAILSVVVRGDANSNQLISICKDGRVCTWQPEKPRSPLTTIAPPPSEAVCNFCAASFMCTSSNTEVVDGVASRLVAGSVEGLVYSTVSKNTRSVDLRQLSDRRHENAVAGVQCHPHHTDPRIAELVLTTSADPACFLWFGSACVVLDAFSDNVHDVAWSPTHPALFAAADGAGRVSLWNISASLLSPVYSAVVQHSSNAADVLGGADNNSSCSPSALKVQWDGSGERLLCGTSNGDVCMFDVTNAAASAAMEASSRSLSDWVSKTFAAEASS
jgi:WD40 repeat protein